MEAPYKQAGGHTTTEPGTLRWLIHRRCPQTAPGLWLCVAFRDGKCVAWTRGPRLGSSELFEGGVCLVPAGAVSLNPLAAPGCRGRNPQSCSAMGLSLRAGSCSGETSYTKNKCTHLASGAGRALIITTRITAPRCRSRGAGAVQPLSRCWSPCTHSRRVVNSPPAIPPKCSNLFWL